MLSLVYVITFSSLQYIWMIISVVIKYNCFCKRLYDLYSCKVDLDEGGRAMYNTYGCLL